MSHQTKRRHCPECRRNVLATAEFPDMAWGCLTAVSCGLLLPVWLILSFTQPYLCQWCGNATKPPGKEAPNVRDNRTSDRHPRN